jgi:hypothetical protein
MERRTTHRSPFFIFFLQVAAVLSSDRIPNPAAKLPGVQVLAEPVANRAKRFPTVGNGQLLFAADLGERAAIRRVIEDRVVTKPVLAARNGCDFAFNYTACFKQNLGSFDDGHGCDESGAS